MLGSNSSHTCMYRSRTLSDKGHAFTAHRQKVLYKYYTFAFPVVSLEAPLTFTQQPASLSPSCSGCEPEGTITGARATSTAKSRSKRLATAVSPSLWACLLSCINNLVSLRPDIQTAASGGGVGSVPVGDLAAAARNHLCTLATTATAGPVPAKPILELSFY